MSAPDDRLAADPPTWHAAPTLTTALPDARTDATTIPEAVTAKMRLVTAAPPAIGVTLVATWRIARHGMGPEVLVLVALGTVAVAVALVQPLSFRRAVHRFGTAVAHAVLAVLLAGIWLLAVALPALFQRILRIDPFAGPALRADSRWVDRARRDVQPTRRWAAEPGLVPVAPQVRRRRRLGAAALALSACAIAGSLVLVATRTTTSSFGILSPVVDARSVAPPFPDETPAAYADADWYPQHQADIAWLWTVATAWDPFSMLRINDVETQTVTVRDGVRRSWKPPAQAGRPPLKIWLYGGSTVFGLGQRDEHTIASELARIAWEDGVALDIDNRGVPGWLHWQDANRFAWDTATYGPPDAVIFYDGFNEIFGTEGLDDVGDGYAPVDPYSAVYWKTLTDDARAPAPPDGARMLETPSLDPDAGDDQAGLIMGRYERSRVVSSDTAKANEVATDWFWQPSRWSRPKVSGEPDSGSFDDWHRLDRELRDRLSPEVHDVAGALDGTKQPYFYDDAHHNEVAARLIAAAMWRDLEPRYTELSKRD